MVSHECLHASPRRSNKKGVSKNECTENSPMSPLAVYLSTSNVPLGSPLSPKMHHMSDWSHNQLVSPLREAGLSPISPMYSHNSPLSAYLSPCKGKRGIDTGSYIATPIRPKLEAMSVSGESAMPPLPSSPMLEQSPSLTYASASGPSLAQISQCLLVGYRWLNHFTLAIAEKSTLTSTSAICLYYLCIGPLDIETIDDDSATSSERRLEKESDGNAHASMCTFFAAYRFITAVTQLYNNVHGGGSQTTRHLFVPSILVFENCVESIRILEMWYREAYNQLLYRPSSKSRGSSTPQTIGSPGTGEGSCSVVREFTPLEAVLPSFPILDPRTPWGDSLWLEVDLLSASVLPVEYRQELDDLDELIRYPQDGDFARDCSYAKGIKGCRTCGRDNYLIGIYGLSHADVAGGHISENIKQNRLLSDELDLARKEIDTLRLDMTRLRERLYMKDALYQRSVLRRRKQIRRTHGLRVENFDLRRMTQHYEQLIERLRSFSHDYLLNSIPEAASNDYTVKRLLGEFDSIVDHANEVAVKWRGASSMRMDAVSEASCADSIDDFLTKSKGSSCEVSGDVVLPHFAWNPDDNEYDRHNQKLLAHFNDAEALPPDYASASDEEAPKCLLAEEALLALIKWYKHNEGILSKTIEENACLNSRLLRALFKVVIDCYEEGAKEVIKAETSWRHRKRGSKIPQWYFDEKKSMLSAFSDMLKGEDGGMEDISQMSRLYDPRSEKLTAVKLFSSIWKHLVIALGERESSEFPMLVGLGGSILQTPSQFTDTAVLPTNGSSAPKNSTSSSLYEDSLISTMATSTTAGSSESIHWSSRIPKESKLIFEPRILDWDYVCFDEIPKEREPNQPYTASKQPLFWLSEKDMNTSSKGRNNLKTPFSIGGGGSISTKQETKYWAPTGDVTAETCL